MRLLSPRLPDVGRSLFSRLITCSVTGDLITQSFKLTKPFQRQGVRELDMIPQTLQDPKKVLVLQTFLWSDESLSGV